MIVINSNPKFASFVQCTRCGRKVFTSSHDEAEIKKERKKSGWTFWDHNVCFCEDCTKVVEAIDE